MYSLTSLLPSWHLTDKTVFLRADLNVPLQDNAIVNDHRLQAIIPTLTLILQKGGLVVLTSHIGRPKKPNTAQSTKNLIPWFLDRGFDVTFAHDINEVLLQQQAKQPIILLENLRFFPGEQQDDPMFAQQLAATADFYVNDAFGTLHRTDSSITLMPRFFNRHNRTIGLLVERELKQLNHLIAHPAQPFVLIIGGGKVSDKIPLLHALLPHVSTILLCPAIASTFLKARGYQMGASLVDDSQLSFCLRFLEDAARAGVAVHMPTDFIASERTFDGPLLAKPISVDAFPTTAVALTIGPETTKKFVQEIKKGKTVFYNGLMGNVQRPETLKSMQELLKAMSEADGFTVIAGGDSVAAAEQLGFAARMSYCSTGGGATLTYLSGLPLPGIEALLEG